MTAFSTVTATPAPLDPTKHVNYTLGLVLGVNDFEQEFAYHSGRDMWLARDAIGSGTVRGLDVAVQYATPPATSPTELVVQPGVGLTPQGQIVRVTTAQCAILEDWIASNQTTIANGVALTTSPPSPGAGVLTLFVILRYKECLTDKVPIPGEPCRSADDAMAASRVTDNFQLDLSVKPPQTGEEPGMRALLGWLSQVPITPGAGSGDLLASLKTSFGITASPPRIPLALPPTPPPLGLSIGAASTADAYRTVLQFYATTLRDMLAGAIVADAVPSETGILLAKATFPVAQTLTGGAWALNGTIGLDTTRPFLLPLDMLKEAWIANASALARYRPVAAGVVPVTTTTGSPPASGLQAIWLTHGEVSVTFHDNPMPGTQYVIKALPYVATSPAGTPHNITFVVTSITTSPPGFTLGVFVDNVVATPATAAGLNLIVEVSAVSGS